MVDTFKAIVDQSKSIENAGWFLNLPPAQEPVASVEWITVPVAEALRETQERQRTPSEKHLNKLKRDMEAERWYVTSQGIGIDTNGTMIDGGHRTLAIVRTGLAQRMVVVRGIDPNAQMATDENRKRTFSDDLQLMRESDYATKAAVTKLVAKAQIAYARGYSFNTMSTLALNRYELMDHFVEITELVDILGAVRTGARIHRRHLAPSSSLGAAHVLGQMVYGRGFTDEFFHRLNKGIGLEAGDAELALTERFRIESKYTPKATTPLYLAWTLKALQAAFTGKSLLRVEFKGRVPRELPQL